MGRPTTNPKNNRITIRMDDNTLKILDRYCKQKGITRTDAVRESIKLLEK